MRILIRPGSSYTHQSPAEANLTLEHLTSNRSIALEQTNSDSNGFVAFIAGGFVIGCVIGPLVYLIGNLLIRKIVARSHRRLNQHV